MGTRVLEKFLGLAIVALLSHPLRAQERWVFRYDGPAAGNDQASGVLAGEDGSLYVVGYSMSVAADYDLIVLSLTPDGEQRWLCRYDGPVNGADLGFSIACGADRSLYAAGSSVGTGTSYDFVAVSLDTAGAGRWVYRYNGPGNGYDRATSVAVGEDGNIYLAGESVGDGTDYDLAIVGLSPQGSERWVYRYNSPDSLADRAYHILAARDGNLYASGYSAEYDTGGPNEDLVLVSLTSQGEERWVYRHKGPGDGDDWANMAVLGEDGNVYVAGRTYGDGTGHDFTVISLTTDGLENWVYSYQDTAFGYGYGYDEALSLVWGTDGNLYIAGCSEGDGTAEDFLVVSLTPNGVERWVYRYDGPGGDKDRARSIVAGRHGTVYAAGYSGGIGTRGDFAAVKLASSPDTATPRWVYRYDGPAGGQDGASSITLAENNDLYVAGYSAGDTTLGDLTVVCLLGDTEDGNSEPPVSPDVQLEAYPIPLAGYVTISYSLPRAMPVRLTIHDTSGRLIRGLVNSVRDAGVNANHWECQDVTGNKVAAGVYLVRLDTPDGSASRKLTVLSPSPF